MAKNPTALSAIRKAERNDPKGSRVEKQSGEGLSNGRLNGHVNRAAARSPIMGRFGGVMFGKR